MIWYANYFKKNVSKDIQERQNRGMESSCEDTKVIQVTENGCWGEGSEVSEMHLSSTYILKVESTGFAH